MPRPLYLGAVMALIASTAAAQQSAPPASVNGTEAGSSNGYWTSNRMMNAKPMPLPPVNGAAVNPSASTPRITAVPLDAGQQQGQPGSRPILPDSETSDLAVRLFGAQTQEQWKDRSTAEEEASPTANSQYGFPFTTSEVQGAGERAGYPFRAAGQLFFTEPGRGDFVCSGSVIRPSVVVIAGHCVAAPASGAVKPHYYTNFMFVPAANNGTGPYGKWFPTWVDTTGEWWFGDGTVPNAQDVGMLVMAEKTARIGDVVGWYGWRTLSLAGQHITMLGYPCNLDNCQVMIRTDAGNSVFGGANTYEYGSAGSGGYSGAPWLVDFGIDPTNTGPKLWNLGTNTVVAVTSYGPGDNAGGYLGASQFNSSFVSMLNTVCGLQRNAC